MENQIYMPGTSVKDAFAAHKQTSKRHVRKINNGSMFIYYVFNFIKSACFINFYTLKAFFEACSRRFLHTYSTFSFEPVTLMSLGMVDKRTPYKKIKDLGLTSLIYCKPRYLPPLDPDGWIVKAYIYVCA